MPSRLDEIRSKRNTIRFSEAARRDFGPWWNSWEEHHEKWSRTTIAAVKELEDREGVALPADYRQFVTEVADGGLGPGCGMFSVSEAFGEAPSFTGPLAKEFPYGTADASSILARRAQGERQLSLDQPNEDGLPGGCLLLAHTGCGCFDVLVITGEQRGFVWYHDMNALFPLGHGMTPLTFLDWYESWLDSWLRRSAR